MTRLLVEEDKLARQHHDEQDDQLAARLIAELTEDDEFDRKIAATAHELDWLIDEALEEDRAGLTQEWQPPKP